MLSNYYKIEEHIAQFSVWELGVMMNQRLFARYLARPQPQAMGTNNKVRIWVLFRYSYLLSPREIFLSDDIFSHRELILNVFPLGSFVH